MYLERTCKRERRLRYRHPYDRNAASNCPRKRPSVTGVNKQRGETKVRARRIQRQKCERRGWSPYLRDTTPRYSKRPPAPLSKRHTAWEFPRMVARHKCPPFFSPPQHYVAHQIQKATKGSKVSFLTRPFCPDKIVRLKGRHCREPPRRPRGNPARHTARQHVAYQLPIRVLSRGHTTLSNPLPGRCSPMSRCVVWTYEALVVKCEPSHFRQPVCRPSILSFDTGIYPLGVTSTHCSHMAPLWPLLGLVGVRASCGFVCGPLWCICGSFWRVTMAIFLVVHITL